MPPQRSHSYSRPPYVHRVVVYLLAWCIFRVYRYFTAAGMKEPSTSADTVETRARGMIAPQMLYDQAIGWIRQGWPQQPRCLYTQFGTSIPAVGGAILPRLGFSPVSAFVDIAPPDALLPPSLMRCSGGGGGRHLRRNVFSGFF